MSSTKFTNVFTPMQERFIECFLVHGNKARAAREAGFSNPTVKGVEMLDPVGRTPHIAEEVARRQEILRQRLELTSERVLKELAAVAFFDPRELLDETGKMKALHELPYHVAIALQSFELTMTEADGGGSKSGGKGGAKGKGGGMVRTSRMDVKFYNKLEALKMLAVHLGILKPDGSGPANQVNVNMVNWDVLMGGRPEGPNPVNDRVDRLLAEAESKRVGEGGSGTATNAAPDETEPPPLGIANLPLPLPGSNGSNRNGHGH